MRRDRKVERRMEIHIHSAKKSETPHTVWNFHFYINDVGRYVALCNTVGGDGIYGEGHNFLAAAFECMTKLARKNPKFLQPSRYVSWEEKQAKKLARKKKKDA